MRQEIDLRAFLGAALRITFGENSGSSSLLIPEVLNDGILMRFDYCAASLTVSEFISSVRGKTLVPHICKKYAQDGVLLSPSEIRSWEKSYPILAELLDSPDLKDFPMLLEYSIPGARKRADVILLSENAATGGMQALILELKGWRNVAHVSNSSASFVLSNGRVVAHPSEQVRGYSHAISEVVDFDVPVTVRAVSYVFNISADSSPAKHLTSPPFGDLCRLYPVFFSDTAADLRRYISDFLGTHAAGWPSVRKFLAGKHSPRRSFFGSLFDKHPLSTNVISDASFLGEALYDDQFVVLDGLCAAAQSHDRPIFVVEGGAGSGKTSIAFSAIRQFLERGRIGCYASVNVGLREGIGGLFEAHSTEQLQLVSDLIKHPGEFDARTSYDFIACDESQRFSPELVRRTLSSSKVVTFFWDPSQKLSAGDIDVLGVVKSFAGGRPVITLTLDGMRRGACGDDFYPWIQELLREPACLSRFSSRPRRGSFEFAIAPSGHALLSHLNEKRGEGWGVALIASFTETDGRSSRTRLREPLVEWAMPGEYEKFWTKKEHNNLTHCASIYGAQGLEVDYVGLIWGKDLVVRDGKWKLHECHTITDYIRYGGSSSLMELAYAKDSRVLDLLIARYNIFLSRPRFGICVYCEDPETAAFLTAHA
ncbi:MAG: DUF2075 domain-containing protein [Deltaproteobacteria bacterium]|nr:DUF2075 domain-containing protein [Deltaproteobacteria bacterium]